ncbi:protein kinase family protein [Catenulispora pinisilvae]|uniref:protein kinase family protein n=1 Tax=Catenulispora pinisilvae TaxID=2705253 RepID=UPI00189229EA|nr:protein kinase family protein [Catenulispora pinisilvae]
MSHASRLAAYRSVSTSLALLSDHDVQQMLDAASPAGSGIGGKSALLEVAGTPVFVKQVPLTDLERRPENVRSTANLFELPAFCHYGVGGPGFGAWRELAVQTMTTDWVLAGDHDGFPLMYHWRVVPDSTPLPEELADVDATVAFWGGGTQVRRRIEQLRDSSASIALFLEYIPQNVFQWLREQLSVGGETADRACALVDRDLAAGISFMNSHGLLHFDAHFQNLLTDGSRLYFADYGLAISSRFELAKDETAFFEQHHDYDRRFAAMYSAQWLVTELFGSGSEDRRARLRAYARGEVPTGIPETAAAILARDAPTAVVMTDFLRALQLESRQAPYPPEP